MEKNDKNFDVAHKDKSALWSVTKKTKRMIMNQKMRVSVDKNENDPESESNCIQFKIGKQSCSG